MDALSFDMSTPEIPHNEAEVARRYKKACSMGYNLACKWEKWQGSEGGDPQVAMEYFVEQCTTKQSPLACVVVGMGKGMKKGAFSDYALDAEGALSIFESTCDKKAYAPACTLAGEMYLQGVSTVINLEKATKLFDEACRAKDYAGCYHLAKIKQEAGEPIAAGKLLSKACRNNNLESCVMQADALVARGNHPGDIKRATHDYGKACKMGWAEQCPKLADLYTTGYDFTPSPIIAMGIYENSCQQGIESGCYGMGALLMDSEHPFTDLEQASFYFNKACKVGHQAACIEYGHLIVAGESLGANVATGLGYLQNGCESDVAKGCLILGDIYQEGTGVQPNAPKSLSYYQKACTLGSDSACLKSTGKVESKNNPWEAMN
jgi:hypothetical protein